MAKTKSNGATPRGKGPALDEPTVMRDGDEPKVVTIGGDMGDSRPAPTPYDVPLARGGPIAMLMVADLHEPAHIRMLQGMHSHEGEPASVEQLKDAQRIARILSMAMFGGKQSALWNEIPKALASLLTVARKRRAVVGIADFLLNFRKRTDEFLMTGGVDPIPDAWNEQVDKALDSLIVIDGAFASLSRPAMVSLFHGEGSAKNIKGIGLAVKLSTTCGALGDGKRRHETQDQATKRVRRNYEKALETKDE
jgi:hypothetical protein